MDYKLDGDVLYVSNSLIKRLNRDVFRIFEYQENKYQLYKSDTGDLYFIFFDSKIYVKPFDITHFIVAKKEYDKQRYLENKDRYKQRYEENKEVLTQYSREYLKNNPDKKKIYNKRYNEKKKMLNEIENN
jgi:nicotinamide riboside kinase